MSRKSEDLSGAISGCLRVFWGHLRLGFPAAGEVPEFPEPSQDWHLAQHPLANSTPVPFEGRVHCPLLALGTWLRQGYRASWFIPPDSSLERAWGLGLHRRPRPLISHGGCCSQHRDFPSRSSKHFHACLGVHELPGTCAC